MSEAPELLHESEVHRACAARYAAIKDAISVQIAKRAEREPEMAVPEIANLQVAQNVLREALEATFKQLVPFTALTAGELALRMASYAISVAPLEEQAEVMRWVLHSLPRAHASRLNQGVMIRSAWYLPPGPSEPVRRGGRSDA